MLYPTAQFLGILPDISFSRLLHEGVALKLTVHHTTMAIPIDYLFLSSLLALEVAESKVSELHVNIIRPPRCATRDKDITGFDVLMPPGDP